MNGTNLSKNAIEFKSDFEPLVTRSAAEKTVRVESSSELRPMRQARAKALLSWLEAVAHEGRVAVDAETIARLSARGWTRGSVERSLDDLAGAGLVELHAEPARIVVRLVGGAS